MRIGIAADQGGFLLTEQLVARHLRRLRKIAALETQNPKTMGREL
jgi:hypothetical protein